VAAVERRVGMTGRERRMSSSERGGRRGGGGGGGEAARERRDDDAPPPPPLPPPAPPPLFFCAWNPENAVTDAVIVVDVSGFPPCCLGEGVWGCCF